MHQPGFNLFFIWSIADTQLSKVESVWGASARAFLGTQLNKAREFQHPTSLMALIEAPARSQFCTLPLRKLCKLRSGRPAKCTKAGAVGLTGVVNLWTLQALTGQHADLRICSIRMQYQSWGELFALVEWTQIVLVEPSSWTSAPSSMSSIAWIARI